ncbi:hypothetical protein T630_3141 [Acinetobacter baumannii MRSN 3527]|uniref:Uncharacterized protein n=1 Tax=Acinetobacter baumannii MRSN 3527 TaxID=1409923 RepID=A0A0J1ADP1_ACIBA|nr:hypothetical protein T630_3141 [Acinetobacter baumannii MRSN 3527]
MQASSFENYIAEKPFTDRFVQQSHLELVTISVGVGVLITLTLMLAIYFSKE